MSKLEGHTPGPWKADCFLVTSERDQIAHVGISTNLPTSRAREIEANARLIAAAPDLLEAVEYTLPTILDACEFLQNGTPIVNGSELHADFIAIRDRLRSLVKGRSSINATKEPPVQKPTRIIVDLRWANTERGGVVLEAKFMNFGLDSSGAMSPVGPISEWELVRNKD